MFQLEKSLSNPDHPYCHFGTGSLETLYDEPKAKGQDIRAELLKFHDNYYSANIMKLCILGRGKLFSFSYNNYIRVIYFSSFGLLQQQQQQQQRSSFLWEERRKKISRSEMSGKKRKKKGNGLFDLENKRGEKIADLFRSPFPLTRTVAI